MERVLKYLIRRSMKSINHREAERIREIVHSAEKKRILVDLDELFRDEKFKENLSDLVSSFEPLVDKGRPVTQKQS